MRFHSTMRILITGGAGFIGSNTAYYYLNQGHDVTILDNFSRPGSIDNIIWLLKSLKKKPDVIQADLRFDREILKLVVKNVDFVVHLAGQVAVTTSVLNPQEDFDNNVVGTFNLLETIRLSGNNPILLYSSTNKVYGGLENHKIIEEETRYAFKDLPFGVSEVQNLDFHSPYGCSKGTADQYVRDYARIYGLNTIVFRQSCIYGPRQFGIEDQGWIAWFIIALTKNKPITIYGNGKQVRDLLFVDDLILAYDTAIKNIKKTKGKIYNIGGGVKQTISIWLELRPMLENLLHKQIQVSFSDIRPGDQPIYISDIRKAKAEFGWKPKITVEEGVKRLFNWISKNNNLFLMK